MAIPKQVRKMSKASEKMEKLAEQIKQAVTEVSVAGMGVRFNWGLKSLASEERAEKRKIQKSLTFLQRKSDDLAKMIKVVSATYEVS